MPDVQYAGAQSIDKGIIESQYIGRIWTPILGPQGFGTNYKIVRTVASNNLTVALKDINGNDFSITNPGFIRIGNTVRTITAALSFTYNAGTIWLNMGSAELAGQDVDIFVYLGWIAATSKIVLIASRYPGARIVGDFVEDSSTVEKGVLVSGDYATTATNEVELIGRFNAILSGAVSASTIDSYSESNQNAEQYIQSGGNLGFGQAFTCTNAATLTSCKFYIRKSSSGTNTGNMVARLYAHSGTYGTSSVTGTLLATSDAIDLSTLGTTLALKEFTFSGANQYAMQASTYYIISVEMQTAPSAPAALYIGIDTSSPSHSGIACYGTYGNLNATLAATDLCFYVYGTVGSSYAWSIPATDIIINRPIFETR